jgi:Tol biopolymer transport system component
LTLTSFAGAATTGATGNPTVAQVAAGTTRSAVVWGKSSVIAFGATGAAGSGLGGVYTIDPVTGGLKRLTTFGGEGGLWMSPNGKTLLFGSNSNLKLYSIAVSGTGLHDLGAGWDGAWSPDGKRIAFSRSDGIYVMNADGTGAHKLVTNNNTDLSGEATWSPDGKKIAYTACAAPSLSDP